MVGGFTRSRGGALKPPIRVAQGPTVRRYLQLTLRVPLLVTSMCGPPVSPLLKKSRNSHRHAPIMIQIARTRNHMPEAGLSIQHELSWSASLSRGRLECCTGPAPVSERREMTRTTGAFCKPSEPTRGCWPTPPDLPNPHCLSHT